MCSCRRFDTRLYEQTASQLLHCKNKWVEVTHAWLPELQLSFDVCNSGSHAWVISTHLFLQCMSCMLHDELLIHFCIK